MTAKACKQSRSGATGNVWITVYMHKYAWHILKYLSEALSKPVEELNISQDHSVICFSVRLLGTGTPG